MQFNLTLMTQLINSLAMKQKCHTITGYTVCSLFLSYVGFVSCCLLDASYSVSPSFPAQQTREKAAVIERATVESEWSEGVVLARTKQWMREIKHYFPFHSGYALKAEINRHTHLHNTGFCVNAARVILSLLCLCASVICLYIFLCSSHKQNKPKISVRI